MATYREIVGKKIKKVSSDPSSGTEGEMWYNSTTGTLRGLGILKAWVSASPQFNAREGSSASFGTQTAGITSGGNIGGAVTNLTEEYNGTGWTTGGALPTSIFDHAGDGTQTSAFSAGGQPTDPGSATTATCSYNGTSWTSLPALSTARKKITGLGASSTAALVFGGQIEPPGASTNASEEYSGSSWTTGGTLNSVRSKSGGAGTQTAGLGFGGYMPSSGPGSPGVLANTETYDGTSWSEVNDMNTARQSLGGFGTQTAALGAGGSTPPQSTATETWDGTNWTTSPATLGTATTSMSSAGTTSGGWIAGGYNPPGSVGANTEEYNSSVSAVTAGAWASGPSRVNTLTNAASADGTPSAWLVWGGRGAPGTPPYTSNVSEEFNGSAFSNTPNLNTAARDRWGGGSEPAAWAAGGTQPAYIAATEEYNGSSWSSVEDMPSAAAGVGSFGPQTAGIWVVGQIPNPPGAYPNAALSYDGTDWTVGPALNTARINQGGGAVGVTTAGLLASGEDAPGSVLLNAEEWGGSSWTSVNSMITGTGGNTDGAFGTQTAAIYAGGNSTSSPNNGVTIAQSYDGTTWSTSPSLGQARKYASEGGTNTSGLITSGQATNEASALSSSEQWTPETTAINVKTLTQS